MTGTLYIYNADAIDCAHLKEAFFAYHMNAEENKIFDKRVYTAFCDDDQFKLQWKVNGVLERKFDIHMIAEWNVWTSE